ncbi:unnamed protein product [Paramecium pentaurelia]|uniref:Uncharacterized protein n=1 Tax=Paramecium pentaurelia TaxID=43138 RepID=A0A8S1UFY8_9CILI|nr:unnamed protein product [Paramecium pentaurelia]
MMDNNNNYRQKNQIYKYFVKYWKLIFCEWEELLLTT